MVAPDRLRFDFNHHGPLTPGERTEIERRHMHLGPTAESQQGARDAGRLIGDCDDAIEIIDGTVLRGQ